MLRDVGENEDTCKPNVLNSSLGFTGQGVGLTGLWLARTEGMVPCSNPV